MSLISKLGIASIKYLPDQMKELKKELAKSNIGIILETFVGYVVAGTIIVFILSIFGLFYVFSSIIKFPLVFSLPLTIVFSIMAAFVAATLGYAYPIHVTSSKKASIEGNLPFAMNHMAAISASGVPPFVIFRLISKVKEYGEVSNESEIIVRNMELFGMDIVTSIKSVASRTPSDQFKQFLFGFISNIETGGVLKTYLENSARDSLFDYRLKREKYLQSLATYADFYTAVLIAAPLFFVSILSVMSLIGGQIFGLDIQTAMQLGIFLLIPVLNTAFLMFIHYTSPSIG